MLLPECSRTAEGLGKVFPGDDSKEEKLMSSRSTTITPLLDVSNKGTSEVTFILEPWGDQYVMKPGATFRVSWKGPRGIPYLTLGDGHVTIWGWEGSTITLHENGIELGGGRWERQPMPPLPKRPDASD